MRTPLSKPVRVLAPEPSISFELRSAVLSALRWAWAHLREDRHIDPMEDDEETVTNAVESLLNEKRKGRRRAPTLHLFSRVERSGQHRASGSSFRQSPDLTFQPRREPREVTDLGSWGLFAECKIIGPKSHHSPKAYCTNGVGRFTDGRYAPRMSTGVMVAYVRDGRMPHSTLKTLLEKTAGTTDARAHETDDSLFYTTHDRSKLPQPCVTIELTHLWLDARISTA